MVITDTLWLGLTCRFLYKRLVTMSSSCGVCSERNKPWTVKQCRVSRRLAAARPSTEELQLRAEGSSSEDTTDEAYERRHRPCEQEEHSRFAAFQGMQT